MPTYLAVGRRFTFLWKTCWIC